MKQGEIYLVEWSPSVGHEFRKTRPAIVISSNALLKRSNLVIFIAITSKNIKMIKDDIPLKADSNNRLEADSVIKMQHISAFDEKRIIHYIGYVDPKIMEDIKSHLKDNFDL